MKRDVLWSILFIAVFIIWNCKKIEENEPELPSEKFVYSSLISEKDSITAGETTQVKAIAKGSHLNYFWSASAGVILGSGAEVTYTAAYCELGKNRISCEIYYSGSLSETKTIEIVVYE